MYYVCFLVLLLNNCNITEKSDNRQELMRLVSSKKRKELPTKKKSNCCDDGCRRGVKCDHNEVILPLYCNSTPVGIVSNFLLSK